MTRPALLLALLAAGCAASQGAPISYGGSLGPPAASPAEGTAVPNSPAANARRRAAPIEYARRPAPASQQQEEAAPAPAPAQPQTPQPNWADGPGTPLSAYALQPQDAQPYDPARLPRSHRVRENESLYDIATLYQVPLRALIDQNHLEPPYALTPGAQITLPPPRMHRVERGESFEDIARAYNVDLRSLALLNRIQPPYEVQVGQQIVLPAMARDQPVIAPPTPPAGAMSLANNPVSETPALQALPTGSGQFAWPLRGQVVARFGPQPGGARLDGIEIAGREGDAVAAAAEGDVVYAGSDLPAYGTLVLVRHADGFVTAYGFARRALVREGQHVRAGQSIAELGPRPDGRARLLFQMRRGTQAIDPLPLMSRAP